MGIQVEHRWGRVSRSRPCPICGKPDYCTVTANGELVNCMRVESQRPSGNRLGGWLHRVADPRPVYVPVMQTMTVVDWGQAARVMYAAGAEERARLSQELGVKVEALEALLVGAGFDQYRGLRFSSWPERNSEGMVVGIVRRYRDGTKKTMRGSHHGLYYGPLPFAMPGPVTLPEGGSDTATLIGIGMNAVGRPSNTGGIADLSRLLHDCRKPIVVLGERDKRPGPCSCGVCMLCWPGLAGAKLTAERLTKALGRHVHVKIFRGAKDAREWVNKHRNASAIEALHTLYDPVEHDCRVCGCPAPHEERRNKNRIEVVCRECRTLLENKRARQLHESH